MSYAAKRFTEVYNAGLRVHLATYFAAFDVAFPSVKLTAPYKEKLTCGLEAITFSQKVHKLN